MSDTRQVCGLADMAADIGVAAVHKRIRELQSHGRRRDASEMESEMWCASLPVPEQVVGWGWRGGGGGARAGGGGAPPPGGSFPGRARSTGTPYGREAGRPAPAPSVRPAVPPSCRPAYIRAPYIRAGHGRWTGTSATGRSRGTHASCQSHVRALTVWRRKKMLDSVAFR
jgi:hypothetical protein